MMLPKKLPWYANLFLLIFFCLVWQTPALAQDKPAGQVMLASGQLTAAQSGGTPRLLQRGSSFYSGDTIKTGAGQAQLRFTDGTIVALRPQSVMRIDDYQFQLSSSDKGIKFGGMKYAVSLVAGGFRTITGAIGKYNPSDYSVTTTVATIGVRGTDYSVAYNTKSKTCGLAAAIQQGSIAIKNAGGILILAKNEGYKYACVESEYTAPQGETAMPAVFNNNPKLGTASTKGGVCLQ